MDTFHTLILFIFFAALFIGITQKIHIPYPIALVLGGITISLLPNIKMIYFEPNLILTVVLPPILYYASFSISFREFVKSWREIFSLALGLVVMTTLIIGLIFKWLFPEFPWALAFAFGAIVSPPDAAAATTLMKRFNISPRLLAIIEGESLVNDASALVLYRLAISALLSGIFSFTEASLEFFKIASGGIILGIILGFSLQNLSRKFFEPVVGVLFSFTIPYITFILAGKLDVSGVLAVVANGLIGSRILAKHHSSLRRVLGFAFWDILIIFMNCFIFILIGLQLKHFLNVMTPKQMVIYATYGVFITSILILVRLLWVYSKEILSYFKTQKNIKMGKQVLRDATIIGWSGMRGIVSLTAALALPYHLSNGQPIEGRDEIIFITFIVIVITLLLPSSTLPYLIRFFKMDHHVDHHKGHQARKRLVEVAENKIHHMHQKRNITDREFNFLKNYFTLQRYVFEISTSPFKKLSNLEETRLKVLQIQRYELISMWEKEEIDDHLFRQLEHELDVEESHIARAEL